MKNILDRRQALTLCRLTPQDDVDIEALGRFADAAWSSDYAGRIRFVYDAAYFRWFLGGDDWTGLLVYDDQSRIVACTFSLFRHLHCDGRLIPATYATAMTVSERHRGIGLGSWMSDRQRIRVFDDCARPLSFSMFQVGHLGLRTVDSSGRRQGNIGMVNFRQGPIWGCRLGGRRDTQREAPGALNSTRIRVANGERGPELQAMAADSTVDVPSLTAYSSLLANARLAFAPTDSFARMYLGSDSGRSGTWLYEFDTGQCAILYSLVKTAVDDLEVGTIGNLQVTFARGVTDEQLARALRHTCKALGDAGCIGASTVEQGLASRAVLEAAGFVPSQDELVFSLRGRPANLDALPPMSLPVSLDFL